MLSIVKLTFREILSRRIFMITLLMTLAFLVFYGVGNHYAAKGIVESLHGMQDSSIFRDAVSTQLVNMGLNFSSMIVALLAILATVGAISSDIESHQIDTMLARPLRRQSLVVGKFFGLSMLVILYALALFIGILLINRFIGGDVAAQIEFIDGMKATLLFILSPLPIVAAALWMSTRLTTINGGIVLIVMYGMGFVGGLIEQVGSLLSNQALVNTGIVSSLVFPFDALFRKMSAILLNTGGALPMMGSGSFASSAEPSNLMLVYAVVYTLGFLYFSIRNFTMRDV